jgi:membrane fusion protein, copper/silver efflux system
MKTTYLPLITIMVFAGGTLSTNFASGAPAKPAAKTVATSSFSQILDDYLKIQDALASDTTKGITAYAQQIEKIAQGWKTTEGTRIAAAAQSIRSAKDIAEARKHFKELSAPFTAWAVTAHPDGIITVFCSMASAKWLQKSGTVRNPYYGNAMLECGEVEKN